MADQAGDADFELVPAFNLVLEGPTDIEALPGSGAQYLVLEKAGRIRLLDAESGQVSTAADMGEVVSSAGREEGLLSLALEPDFERTGALLVYYSADRPRRAILSR